MMKYVFCLLLVVSALLAAPCMLLAVTLRHTGSSHVSQPSSPVCDDDSVSCAVADTLVPPAQAEAVDLGLSVKWANMNVGASTPEGYGDFFAWGETTPKNTYNLSAYKWSKGTKKSLFKYCTDSEYGMVDDKTVLEPSDDAATAQWGSSWRMPTAEEFDELCDSCSWAWTTQNDVNGYLVTGPSGNSIFLPAAGCRYDKGSYYVGTYGYYWTSSVVAAHPNCARYLFFKAEGTDRLIYDRDSGRTVRPVAR